jgi:hypothetical protein
MSFCKPGKVCQFGVDTVLNSRFSPYELIFYISCKGHTAVDLPLLTQHLVFQKKVNFNAAERKPVTWYHVARLSAYLKCSSVLFGVLERKKRTSNTLRQ